MTYNRPTTIPDRQHQAIANAYALAGVKQPSNVTEAMSAIDAEPTADQVAQELAVAAYDAKNAKVYLEDALTRMARAQAADALRQSIARVAPQVRRNKQVASVAQAVADLTPAFSRMVTDLVKAAKQLDPERPASLENAVRDDSTRELKIAQGVVAALGTFAAIHVNQPVRDVPPLLASILPIVELPHCTVEVTAPSEMGQTLNASDLAGTRTVRDLARALERGIDDALILIARGTFEGVSFRLNDRDTYREVAANASRAYKRKRATIEQRRLIESGAR